MNIIDEEVLEKRKSKRKKIRNILIVLIILLIILGGAIVSLIVYEIKNPSSITAYIDGVPVNSLTQILDVQTDENGKTQIYIQIREFASYLNKVNEEFNYQSFKGDYNPKTEDEDKCHIIRDKYEVAIYTKKSKVIYKLNLQNGSQDYEECYIDKDVFENNGQLYTTVDGLEKGYNVIFTYDESKKTIKIYTLDNLIQRNATLLADKTIQNYGTFDIKANSYTDNKSILDNLLIVQASSNHKFGIVKTSNYASFILEPQYDRIEYINDSKTFLVESDNKVGMFSQDGKRKINLIYDEIISMGQNSNLYLVKSGNTYGVVDGDGNIILHPEYEAIGINVSPYAYNGVKNGYILLNSLIPVYQNKKWALFNKKGEMVTKDFKYTEIGCSKIKNINNIYPLLAIPDYNVIVVKDEYDKYGFVDVTGNDNIIQFISDQIYIKISAGEMSYKMTYKDKEYEALKYLQKVK